MAAPTLGSSSTPSTATQARRSKVGFAHSGVSASTRRKPPTTVVRSVIQPPLDYSQGPNKIQVEDYKWQFVGERVNGDPVLLNETTNVSWDDASAVMTGSITFQTPTWQTDLGLGAGCWVSAFWSQDDGHNWVPAWRMRIMQPNQDYVAQIRTANLANDLSRLQQSIDSFKFVDDKTHKGGWTVKQVIEFVLNRYKIPYRPLPAMNATVTKWVPIDVSPLDVIVSALLRQKHFTGLKYQVSVDSEGYVVVSRYLRPTVLYEIGAIAAGATYAAQMSTRFATDITMYADPLLSVGLDSKGHAVANAPKKSYISVSTPNGQKVFGYVHRNEYSPDATTKKVLRTEGQRYLAAVAFPLQTLTLTVPGMPFVRRLDAFQAVLPQLGKTQVVYVSEAQHTVDGTAGYQTMVTLAFEDPYAIDWRTNIENKLKETAASSKRPPGSIGKTASGSASAKPSPPAPKLGSGSTPAQSAKQRASKPPVVSSPKVGGKTQVSVPPRSIVHVGAF